MKRVFKWLGSLLGAGILALALFAIHTIYFKPLTASLFYNKVLLTFLLDDPELMTTIGLMPSWVGSFDRRLTDASPEHEAKIGRLMQESLETLHGYDRATMDEEGKLSYDSMEIMLVSGIQDFKYRNSFPVNQLFGIQSQLPNFLTQQHQIGNRREAEDYVARLNLFGWKFDGLLASLKERADRGVVPPHFAIVEVLDQMKGFVGKAPVDNPLYVSFAEKLDKLPANALTTEVKGQLLKGAESAIKDQVYPAYGKLIAYFTELEPKFTGDNGAWSLPQGEAYYAWRVKDQTTADLSPDDVHALGLAEVARVGTEMDAALRKIGKMDGTVGDRIKALQTDPSQFYPNDDEGRAAILRDYTQILAEADKATTNWFNRRPKTAITVKSVPEFAQATAPTAYYEPGDMSGNRGGVFYFNQRDLKEQPKWEMRTLAYHEGIPGHHFQISISQELTDLPMFRRVVSSFLFTAYTEGWALYAEHLAGEMGLEENPYDALGRMRAEMLRSVRLVVDSGIHAKHWTREQAIDYMETQTGMGHGEVVAEIERYFVDPGQALAYKVGELKILELREKAKKDLGDKFDIKAFHDQILTHGGLAMTSLQQVVDAWIEKAK